MDCRIPTRPATRPVAGFTLVELLVVITIAAILAILILPAVQQTRVAGWHGACANNLWQFGTSLHEYELTNGHFPSAVESGLSLHVRLLPEFGYQYEPFLLDDESRIAPTTLGCIVVHKKSLLRYEITYGAKAIRRETLAILGEHGETKLIDRQSSREIRGNLIAESAANQLYVKEMQPNVSVLSKLAQHGPHQGGESVQPFYQAIRNATQYRDYTDASGMRIKLGSPDEDRFADDAAYREWIMRHLIQAADLGIRDVETHRASFDVPDLVKEQIARMDNGFRLPDKRVVVSFVHEGKASCPIDFSVESSGTQKLFNIASDWWTLANERVTLLADELSAGLHPRLLDRLIRAVNDAPTARVKSQLIFATHDTGLLESQDGQPPALRRDQVYFTKKDADGASELYSLAQFKDDARHVHNIRKRYLSGLYGAIPSGEKLSL